MSIPQRAVALLVAIIVLAGASALAVRGLDPGVGAAQTQSPATTPRETPSPSPSPARSASPDDAAIFAEIEAAVEANRGLPPAEIAPPELISREELGAELETIFAEEYPLEEQRRDVVALRALGLLTAEQEIAPLQLQLLGDQVLGFYDPIDQRMVVVSDAGITAESKITYAHEYTHALQDAAFDLTNFQDEVADDDDQSLARTGVFEGDASLSMLSWAINGGLTPDELLGLTQIDVPDTTGIPGWMVAQLEFPYTAGFEWASRVAGGDPLAPDWPALDAAFADPPQSSEQILHFEKWEAGEAPMSVDLPDLAAALGSGWEATDTTTLGEAMIGDALTFLGVEGATATAAAAGWGGDRVTVATGPDDTFALLWRIAWDTEADATEFVAAYETARDALPFASDVRTLVGGGVLIAHGSSRDIVTSALDAAGE